MNSAMTRRATSVSIASSVGSSNGASTAGAGARSAPVTVMPLGRAAADARAWISKPIGSDGGSAGDEVETRLGAALGRRVVGQAGPLGHDPAQLADLELGPLVAQQRQRDPLAPDVGRGDVDREQALVVERRAEDRPGRSGR